MLPNPLVLPNAWDAASARVSEACGAAAIATSSAGLAWSLGYADGQYLPFEELLGAIRRIVRVVHVPVSADIEGGYGERIDDLLRSINALVDTGAVACNIEDWDPKTDRLIDADTAYERIAAVKKRFGDAMYVNARCDIYFREAVEGDLVAATCERLRGFALAGCDGVFVPGPTEGDEIRAFVAATDRPLNVLAMPGSPDIAEMRELGVRRVSTGSSPMSRIMRATADVAHELLDLGTYNFIEDRMPYSEANALFLPT